MFIHEIKCEGGKDLEVSPGQAELGWALARS